MIMSLQIIMTFYIAPIPLTMLELVLVTNINIFSDLKELG